jgi:hypothetical protein
MRVPEPRLAALALAAAFAVAGGATPAGAGEQTAEATFQAMVQHVPKEYGSSACLTYTLRPDRHEAKHLYFLVDARRDLRRARALAHWAGPDRHTTVALNPARFAGRAMDRIGRALRASTPAPTVQVWRNTQVAPADKRHCPPYEIDVAEGDDAQHEWANAQQQHFGADRVIVRDVAPIVPG